EAVTVAGRPGYWIDGAHAVDLGPLGGPARLRVAGDALVWVDGARTYRLESALGRTGAVAAAEALVAARDGEN
ncbi:MAG TPA: hypothetical protein VFI47_09010, partial [Acidimicrobiales bacterium]|nr:hypothetical protein [Acidimicrobiales bacterium]